MIYRFGDCTLEAAARELRRSGQVVSLSPKAFQLLLLLITRRPEALSKDQITQTVWNGVFVGDSSLARVITEIRSAIGDSARAPRLLRTVHGFGYAFTRGVEEQPAPDVAREPPALVWLMCGTGDFRLGQGTQYAGRDADVAVQLNAASVSRRHARFVIDGTSVTVEDLGSKNGTYVRGCRIAEPTPLEPGDEVRIGPFTLTLRLATPSGSTQTELLTP